MPGWVDTVQGFNQALMGIGIGAIRVLNIDGNANLHIVPADFVCNALIATAWETGTFKNRYCSQFSPQCISILINIKIFITYNLYLS